MILATRLFLLSAILTIGGALMALRNLPTVLAAGASGAIMRRGHRPVRIERAVEPERFDKLLKQRWIEIGGFAAMGVASLPFTVVLGIAAWKMI